MVRGMDAPNMTVCIALYIVCCVPSEDGLMFDAVKLQ